MIFRILTDKELMKVIFWSGRFISLILFGFAYLFTPNDLIPDEDNGIFGWIDDLGVIFIILIIMGIVVYNKMTQLSAMRVHA